MPFEALLASDSEIVPVGAIELWCVKRAPTSASFVHQLRAQLRRRAACSGCNARAARGPAACRRPCMPSRAISGRLRSISAVTSNSSFMIGAGPFSAREFEAGFPAGHGQSRCDTSLGEAHRLRASRTSCAAS